MWVIKYSRAHPSLLVSFVIAWCDGIDRTCGISDGWERLAQQDRSGGSFLNCIIVILGFPSEGHGLIHEIQSHRSVVPGRILEVALSILAILKVECHGDFHEYVTWNWHGD